MSDKNYSDPSSDESMKRGSFVENNPSSKRVSKSGIKPDDQPFEIIQDGKSSSDGEPAFLMNFDERIQQVSRGDKGRTSSVHVKSISAI